MAAELLLIVDDNPVNLKLMTFLLESRGYRVSSAVDAESARVAIAAERPRLILMDIQLPGVDGLELTRQLRAAPETRPIPIIALTAYAMKGDEERALDAGCDAYVTKPVDTRTLPALVARVLEGSRRADP